MKTVTPDETTAPEGVLFIDVLLFDEENLTIRTDGHLDDNNLAYLLPQTVPSSSAVQDE